jgi:hypothetical protein
MGFRFFYYTPFAVDFATKRIDKMSTINGQKSVFVSVASDSQESQQQVSMADYHAQQVADAIEFANELQAWLDDDAAQAEYQAWSELCRAEEQAARRAECHELARLEEYGIGHAFNGDDLRWQQGGN